MTGPRALLGLLALGLFAFACTHSARAPHAAEAHVRWLVIAPHPDDEALIAGGVLARATEAHEPVAVVVMTNGDYDCVVDGLVRQRETLRALAELGVSEEQVRFLGYPDGSLAKLGTAPLPSLRRKIDGRCVPGNTTYGTNRDPVLYTRENAVSDLARLLRELTPDDVVVTHPADTHPDHGATYALFRDALERVSISPRVHRAMVHNGDCWPISDDVLEPCPDKPVDLDEPTLPLTGRLAGYVAPERIPVADRARHRKIRAIAAYVSQTHGAWNSYLFAFARSDEMFFPESRTALPPPAAVVQGPPPLRAAVAGYRLEVDAAEARLWAEASERPRKAWPLPHDLWRNGVESCSITLEKRDMSEVALRCHGALIGIAIAPSATFDAGAPMH